MQTHDEIRIEPVRDPDDLMAASLVLLRSFAGQQNARLGFSYVHAVMQSFTTPRSFLQVAWVGHRFAGFVAGGPSGEEAARYRTLRSAAALALLRRPWLLCDPAIVRMAARRAVMRKAPAPPASWFLSIIGVDPALHGRGIGQRLLEAFEEEGKRRGFSEASLQVHVSNAAARRLYERSGWHASGKTGAERVSYERSLVTT